MYISDPGYFIGYIYGRPTNAEDPQTGEDLAYIYPDFMTALRGKFVDGKMVEARETKIVAYR